MSHYISLLVYELCVFFFDVLTFVCLFISIIFESGFQFIIFVFKNFNSIQLPFKKLESEQEKGPPTKKQKMGVPNTTKGPSKTAKEKTVSEEEQTQVPKLVDSKGKESNDNSTQSLGGLFLNFLILFQKSPKTIF